MKIGGVKKKEQNAKNVKNNANGKQSTAIENNTGKLQRVNDKNVTNKHHRYKRNYERSQADSIVTTSNR